MKSKSDLNQDTFGIIHLRSNNNDQDFPHRLTFGELVWMVLKMFMSTRKMVTSSVIRPGITSGFTRNEILEA